MKRYTRVKIDGFRETEHILAAAEAGAHFVGIVFAESKRQVAQEKAVEMVKAVRKLERPPAVVGVFVNAPAVEVNRIAVECDLDLVQLSGDEDWDYCKQIEKPVIQVIHISNDQTVDDVTRIIEEGYQQTMGRDVMYLLDTKVENAYGGTGKAFNRQIAAGVARKMPVFIAGGLDPDNVGEVISEVYPWGVDVSSGVETDGVKDVDKIRDFISEVKAVAGG
ncbi:MAG: phosphoribosylanthranilate isomerase [Dehalococcoidales bacterium]|nr:phosphoribosylanthranilate isomerase [Dehalococcoidales bacterium]